MIVELCRLMYGSFYLTKLYFTQLLKSFPYCCLLIIAS